MTGYPRAVAAGAWAALRSPGWMGGARLAELLRAPEISGTGPAVPRGARGGAMRALKVLALLPGSRWRNTCLYRSVAECLVLRGYGVPAYLRIGVKSDGEGGEVLAHAWVVRADTGEVLDLHSAGGHQPLEVRA